MKKLNVFLCFLLSLVMTMTFCILQFSIFTRFALYNENFYYSNFKKNNVYENITKQINNNLTNLSRYNNVPSESIENLVTVKWVKNEIDSLVLGSIDYMKYTKDKLPQKNSKYFNEEISNNSISALKDKGVVVNSQVNKQVESFSGQISTSISNQINIVNFNSLENSSAFQKIRKAMFYLYKYMFALVALIVIIGLATFGITKGETIFDKFNWIIYSLIASLFITIVPLGIFYFGGAIGNLNIANVALKKMLISLVNNFLLYFIVMDLIGIVIIFVAITVKTLKQRS